MPNIFLSADVLEAISSLAAPEETPDATLRRVLRVGADGQVGISGARRAQRKLSLKVLESRLLVRFEGSEPKEWKLPERDDKAGLRTVTDHVLDYIRQSGGTVGQRKALQKTLRDAGYLLRHPNRSTTSL